MRFIHVHKTSAVIHKYEYMYIYIYIYIHVYTYSECHYNDVLDTSSRRESSFVQSIKQHSSGILQ